MRSAALAVARDARALQALWAARSTGWLRGAATMDVAAVLLTCVELSSGRGAARAKEFAAMARLPDALALAQAHGAALVPPELLAAEEEEESWF